MAINQMCQLVTSRNGALVEIPHIVSEKVAEFILEEESVPVVVSGFRSLCEVDWLLDNLKFTGKRFQGHFY